MSGEGWAEAFLEMMSVERAAAANTLRAYGRDLEDAAGFLAARGLTLASAEAPDVEAYFAELGRRGLSPATASRRRAALRQFYRFVLGEGWRADDPSRRVDAPRRGRPLPRVLSRPEAAALIAATPLGEVVANWSYDIDPLSRLASGRVALIGDAAFLGRVSALVNLYAIDPHDPEVGRDLNRSRRQMAQVWLDVQADQLESLYRTPFGQLTDNLIASDFAKDPLGIDDITMRHQLAQVASDLRDPHALNALMAALLYYPIKQVKLPATKDLLPPWLSQSLSHAS